MTNSLKNYMPLKKLSKKEIKLKDNPWFTVGIRVSIKRRDRLLRKYIDKVDKSANIEIYDQHWK